MKLLMINPRDKSTCGVSNHFPPLSLGYVAGITPSDWHIELVDENIEEFSPRKADLVAISAMTIQANRAYEICGMYRRMGVPVVLGGIHVTLMPEEAMGHATSIVVGEAEGLWQRVIDDFEHGTLERVYKSTAYPDLANEVFPRRDLFSDKYLFDLVQTSRGCPFQCDYCSVPVLNGRKYRVRPTEAVIEELKTIRKRHVFFVDDNIVGHGVQNEDRAIALFEGMIQSGTGKTWVSQASVNVAGNDRLLKLMKKSGCIGLLIGFESVDVTVLEKTGKVQNIRKDRQPINHYRDVVSKLHKHGIAVVGYFSHGIYDTEHSIIKSCEFILDSGVDIVNTPIVVPSPGTNFFRKMYPILEHKDFPMDWNRYSGGLLYRPENVSKKAFYKAHIAVSLRLNSIKEIMKRTVRGLLWSRDLYHALMIMLFNVAFRRLRRKTMMILLQYDLDFRQAWDEMSGTSW